MDLKYLVTGAAGFIGFHMSNALLERGDEVIGIDNLNEYYDPILKKARLLQLSVHEKFRFFKIDLIDYQALETLFATEKFDSVCHLAAQAGVRYSISNPFVYQKSNVEGFLNILELCRCHQPENLVYASSSSVYGGNEKMPFSVQDRTDRPISLYAATKKTNELMAYTYHHLYGMKCTGLRFFSVYGPWGRPDMALYTFSEAILGGREIELYNYGKMKRDFTYVDDIVGGIIAALDIGFEYEVLNLGNSHMVELGYFVECIEKELGLSARKAFMSLQPGDVPATCADIEYSREKLGFQPRVSIEEGVSRFIAWFKRYKAGDFDGVLP